MAPTSLRARWTLAAPRPSLSARRIQQPSPIHHLPRRHASTTSVPAARAKLLLYTTAIGTTLVATYLYATDTRASLLHQYLVPPLLRLLVPDAENAHHLGTNTLQALYAAGLHPRERTPDPPALAVRVFPDAAPLANPIGISAGLDKDAVVPDALFALGAAVVEVGGCTPAPQAGNERPRVWRVPGLEGMVNRYGLNSAGADKMAARLRARLAAYARSVGFSEDDVLNGKAGVPPGSLAEGKMLAVQVAKGKNTDERDVEAVVRDYVYCVQRLGRYADVLVVNVSSPNTPGLRDLQATEPLTRLLSAVVDEAGRTGRRMRPKVMVKVSPDEDTDAQVEGICRAIWESGVDGVVVGNTTKRRTGLVPEGVKLLPREQRALLEVGGFSGPALFEHTVRLVGRYRKILDQQSLRSSQDAPINTAATPALPAVEGVVSGTADSTAVGADQKIIFASGGITTGDEALKVLNAGASVAMVYTGLVYGGAGTITRIKGELQQSARGGVTR